MTTPAQKQLKAAMAQARQGGGQWTKARPRPRHTPGQMNKMETAYSVWLDLYLIPWLFEAVTLKIGDNCRYTPDFVVQRRDHIEFHEVKGYWEDDARVKIKAAATRFPMFTFIAVTKKGGEWQWEEIKTA